MPQSAGHVGTKWRTRSSDYTSAVFTNTLQFTRNRFREARHTFQTVLADLQLQNGFESWE